MCFRYPHTVRLVVFSGLLNSLNWERLGQFGWFCDFPIQSETAEASENDLQKEEEAGTSNAGKTCWKNFYLLDYFLIFYMKEINSAQFMNHLSSGTSQNLPVCNSLSAIASPVTPVSPWYDLAMSFD